MAVKVLVTGANGFIGRMLTRKLIEASGYDVWSSDVHTESVDGLSQYVAADLRDRSAVHELVKTATPELVFHLGARTDLLSRDVSDYGANTDGVTYLIEAIRFVGSVRRTVYTSSRMVCRTGYSPTDDLDFCPPNAYGESKVFGERVVRDQAAGEWVIVRPTSIWGPGFGIPYRDFFDHVRAGRYVHPRGLDVWKSFGYVENTVAQLIALGEVRKDLVDGKVFYLCDYTPLEVRAFANRIRAAWEMSPVRTVPLWLLRIGGVMGDMLRVGGWSNPPLTTFRVQNLVTEMLYPTSDLAGIVGALPVSLDEGVARTVGWLKSDDGGTLQRRTG